jgi:hypothetical protein
MSEEIDKMEAIIECELFNINPLIHSEIRARFQSLKRLISMNIKVECTCLLLNNHPDGKAYVIRNDCPVHKGNLTHIALCPAYMENSKCAWSPERLNCGGTPCKNLSLYGGALSKAFVEGKTAIVK